MTTTMHFWWQILVAAIVYFALGALWYNQKVLGTLWANSHGLKMDPEEMKKVNMGKLMSMSFLCTVVICAIVCWVCNASCGEMSCHADGGGGMMHCVKSGLVVGIAAASAISMGFIYQMKPMASYLIDGGYHITGCVLASVVFYFLGCC